MVFSQLDGSITGGMPATFLTEPVWLKAGTHIETVIFIVFPVMTEPMVLGLAWMKKWISSVSWDGEKWQMR